MSTPSPPHALSEDEWPALRATINAVFRPSGGDLTAECPLLFERKNWGNLRVISSTEHREEAAQPAGPLAVMAPVHEPPLARRQQAQILAHAGFVTREALVLRRKVRVSCIGAVATVASHRGQGLGSRVFADALGGARRGADLVLVSGDRGLYRRQGLDPVPPLTRFRVSPTAEGQDSLETREATAGDLKSLAALYDGEDVHFVRSPDDWALLWGAGRLVDAAARFWVVARGGRDVAYLVAQQPGTRPGGSLRPRRILEFAGDRQAILLAAPALAEELLVPGYDSSMMQLCEQRGWRRATRHFLLTAEALTPHVLVIPWYGLNYV